LYQKIETDKKLLKWNVGDVETLQHIYQSAFDELVDEMRGSKRDLLFSTLDAQLREHKEANRCIKDACARVMESLYEGQVAVIHQLVRLVVSSVDMSQYSCYQEQYQGLSMLWMDMTNDASGKLEDEVVVPSGFLVKQMYLLPWLDESKDASEMQGDKSKAAENVLSYLRLACSVAVDVSFRMQNSHKGLDSAVEDCFREFLPAKIQVDPHVSKIGKMLQRKGSAECRHGKVTLMSSPAA